MMKILFLLPGNTSRTGELSGTNIRYGETGASGTETSIIYVAEYLAKKFDYDITIASEVCTKPLTDNKVKYTNFQLQDITNKEYDIIISCLWFKEYSNLPIKVKYGFIYWYHLAWGYGAEEIFDFVSTNKLKCGTVSASNWAYKHNIDYHDRYKDLIKLASIIPNPVATDIAHIVTSENITRNKHKIIFHAQWSRGGDVALSAAKKLNWPDLEFKSFDYVNSTGIDKYSLFKELASSQYFIFPILTHGKLMYQDTFSLSVAEAISMGVEVLTYPLGAIPEYFNNHVHFIGWPKNIESKIDTLKKERVFEAPEFSDTDNIVKLLSGIDKANHFKCSNGKIFIERNFDISIVANKWHNFIQELLR